MDTEKEVIARNLMEVFYQFSRLNWIQNSPTGLRHSELIVLHCISRRTKEGAPGIKVSEISSILKVTSPTITQILNGLYTKGLIERCADKDDRRAVPVRLTEKGRIVVEESSESFLKSFTRAYRIYR